MPGKTHKTINIALQGGGSHGAFAWGVIDRLLEENDLHIEGVSATSMGAMNGAVLACGLAVGRREDAREMLKAFWKKISNAALLSPLQPTFFDKMLGNTHLTFSPSFMALDMISRVFSPYQFNLFDINPIKDILAEMIDFEALNRSDGVRLFLSATNVRTGGLHIFENGQITLESILAASCLPYIFKTVEVDEAPYWEGSFSANPSLTPLVKSCQSPDIMLVQTLVQRHDDVPTKATDILDRANELSFNATLVQELRGIDFINRLIEDGHLTGGGTRKIHLHLAEAESILANLGRASKLNGDWEFLCYLRDTGRQSADDWLSEHKDSIGQTSSVDIRQWFGI